MSLPDKKQNMIHYIYGNSICFSLLTKIIGLRFYFLLINGMAMSFCILLERILMKLSCLFLLFFFFLDNRTI